MNLRIALSLLTLFAGTTLRLSAQEAPPPKPAFSADWTGDWKGTLRIGSPTGKPQEVPMELHIHPQKKGNGYQWQIVYGEGARRQERNYELLSVEKEPTHFVIDEKNGIMIDAYLLGDVLQSQFEVSGSRISSRYELRKGRLLFEITAYSTREPRKSGVKEGGNQTDVLSYKLLSTQSAELARMEAKREEGKKEQALKADPYTWSKLTTELYRGKQDDIFFVTPEIGWYGNGAGKIFKTTDGGKTWVKQLDRPGTYFRCLAFLDERHGFAGNIGTGYFPNVTDETPLYETKDGGQTWEPVTKITGPKVTGLCAIDILRTPFINAGKLEEKVTLIAVGRVGGPTCLLRSEDGGATWKSQDMTSHCGMILDVKFFSPERGILCAGSDRDVQKSNALILMTTDGGKTWEKKYQSDRPFELTWKGSFPTEKTGYVTIQSYNPDKAVTKRYVAKTTDGGNSWKEIELTDDFTCREFGIGFAGENLGWVGGMQTGYLTTDGGKTWAKTPMGTAVNKIRLLKTPRGWVGYAIGVDVYKLDTRSPAQ